MSETAVPSRYIADGAITNAKVNASAAIATAKLADSANFILRGGSVAFTGDQSMGNNKLTNVTTASASGDAVNKGQLDAALAALPSAYKYRNVKVASTANITISNPGAAVFDGITLSAGDRILLKNQSAPAENGIRVFDTSSTAMVRATDSDAWTEITGTLVYIDEGTVNADTRYYCTSNSGGTLDTTAIAYAIDSSTGLTTANFVDKEVPSGSINGSNTAFVLANTPTSGTEHAYLEGLLMRSGSGNDYTISGATLTFTTAPLTGEWLVVSYRK